MSSQKLKSLLLQANSTTKKVQYKKMFITSSGTEYRVRPLSTKLIDPSEVPFIKVKLHGGYKHPNYEGDFSSNFRCLGKDCPMCEDVKQIKNVEYKNQLPKEMRTAWKKEKNQYSIFWGINKENNEVTLVLVPDTDRFKKEKDDAGKDTWKKVNTTCQEILFNKLMGAVENGLDPFDYSAGNDIVIKSRQVDNIVHWDISVLSEKNSISEEVKQKLQSLPKLEDLYKHYSKEELEYIVAGKPYNKDLTKQKQSEEKVSTEDSINSMTNESYDEHLDSSIEDEEALFSDDSSDLSQSLRDILNKKD